MSDNPKRLTISGFERIAEEHAQAERDAKTGDDPAALASWESTLAVIRYMKEHGVPESLKDEETG